MGLRGLVRGWVDGFRNYRSGDYVVGVGVEDAGAESSGGAASSG